jgi:hypothetical protein
VAVPVTLPLRSLKVVVLPLVDAVPVAFPLESLKVVVPAETSREITERTDARIKADSLMLKLLFLFS